MADKLLRSDEEFKWIFTGRDYSFAAHLRVDFDESFFRSLSQPLLRYCCLRGPGLSFSEYLYAWSSLYISFAAPSLRLKGLLVYGSGMSPGFTKAEEDTCRGIAWRDGEGHGI